MLNYFKSQIDGRSKAGLKNLGAALGIAARSLPLDCYRHTLLSGHPPPNNLHHLERANLYNQLSHSIIVSVGQGPFELFFLLKQKNVESILFGGRRISEQTNMEKLEWIACELALEHQRRSCHSAPTITFKQASPKLKIGIFSKPIKANSHKHRIHKTRTQDLLGSSLSSQPTGQASTKFPLSLGSAISLNLFSLASGSAQSVIDRFTVGLNFSSAGDHLLFDVEARCHVAPLTVFDDLVAESSRNVAHSRRSRRFLFDVAILCHAALFEDFDDLTTQLFLISYPLDYSGKVNQLGTKQQKLERSASSALFFYHFHLFCFYLIFLNTGCVVRGRVQLLEGKNPPCARLPPLSPATIALALITIPITNNKLSKKKQKKKEKEGTPKPTGRKIFCSRGKRRKTSAPSSSTST
ncbi:hypothetical protein M5K25_014074 [Dendrobium thyrsiflorum]|uniref:Uncharacterized protein n=1 Tax=Dendrobium thyrsiflorum TaxID=117978 RepID=A0ABD0UVH8_DENTH